MDKKPKKLTYKALKKLHKVAPQQYEQFCVKHFDDLLKALINCKDALDIAFDFVESDVFGIHHNNAVDALSAAGVLIAKIVKAEGA